ncbi:hypothetical protein BC939DRAFT_76644 [Gamsiella multidivaricata]|uniref:uncharacterized protein n=1 Tax=Gamsiella multidivaricata TaxID=101098 RepID=UPI002220683A|nr:uncharacterized protein BC939DRAFT_76644 [Gamsiella multidivaricata]KAI7827986.1 hypothetical protein BC939DRAFT_76644 [Gamsiella multidivaricata]
MDLISRNNSNLRTLTLEMDENAKQRDMSSRMIFVAALVPHSSVSRLSSVRLHGICLSRDSFASLLRGCPLLTSVDLQQDESEWACKQLQQLRVRIRGLDTKEKVNRALELWREGMEKDETDLMDEEGKEVVDGSNESHVKKEDTSIEARVAKHLLKFDELKEVWLGTRTCYA